LRLDFYENSIVLSGVENGAIYTRMVSALDICRAVSQDTALSSGLLPDNALWWSTDKNGPWVALWRPPQIWQVALMAQSMKEPERMKLPMPGLVFACSPGQAPKVWAAKKRPTKPQDALYHAPLPNMYQDARSCSGTHRYPEDVTKIPESFFLSFFSPEGTLRGRSKKFPDNVMFVWPWIAGKRKYPLRDLERWGTVEEAMHEKRRLHY